MARIYLSPPHLSPAELEFVKEAFATNWIAPLGPHVDAFENEVAAIVGTTGAAALSSGTAALHLALRLLDLQPDDEVFCSSLTFCASANPILYEGGRPVFLDSDAKTWNLNPQLLADELKECASRNKLPRGVIVVDLYGQCADYAPIEDACARYDVPIIEDAAEALGASYGDKMAGSLGTMGVLSFNGNKIITTSGGGMLVSNDVSLLKRAKHLATQARDPAPHYQHSEMGFNYRMSNVLAGIGRGQLRVLRERIAARKKNFSYYKQHLADVPGVRFLEEAPYGRSNHWLTCLLIDPRRSGVSRDDVMQALAAEDIEARPVWKPLHLQPLFAGCRKREGEVAERIFQTGLCLPSGSNLSEEDRVRIVRVIQNVFQASSLLP